MVLPVEPELDRQPGELRTAPETGLVPDTVQMGPHGRESDEQRLGDLLIGRASTHEGQDLLFTGGQSGSGDEFHATGVADRRHRIVLRAEHECRTADPETVALTQRALSDPIAV